MTGNVQTLNIIAIILAIIGAVLCLLAFITVKQPDSYRFGLTVDQAYSSSTNLFVMALVIWVGSWYNFHLVSK